MRFFNNAGPVDCVKHYCLDPIERIKLFELEALIAQERYFVLHAPRQTGKTSSLLALMHHLNGQGRCRCVYTNVKAESIRMGNFSAADCTALYRQHTDETGQVFTNAALERVWELTRGQPWLVNALGYQLCFRNKVLRERSRVIDAEQVVQAAEVLIQRRDTHLDQLADKLREPRVRRVIEPILAGGDTPEHLPEDDVDYVRDLGLITTDARIEIANAIYREVIPRQLTYTASLTIAQEPAWFIRPDGRLELSKLLEACQVFFREHSEHWIERFDYKEAGPQLLLQAFLQRIVNGGGRIEREYGFGRMRTDLLVIWPYGDHGPRGHQVQKAVLELKILHKGLDRTIAEGLRQTHAYLDRSAAAEAHLLIFDRGPRDWSDKLFHRREPYHGTQIEVWGM